MIRLCVQRKNKRGKVKDRWDLELEAPNLESMLIGLLGEARSLLYMARKEKEDQIEDRKRGRPGYGPGQTS